MTKALTLLLALLASCATLPGANHSSAEPVAFELGASDFPGDDVIRIERVTSQGNGFESGSLVTVEGRFELHSRPSGILLFSVTVPDGASAPLMDDCQHCVVERGDGSFSLSLVMPSAGWPHITFYDPKGGSPFGGVYFGSGDNVLHEKSWPYNPPPR